MRIPNKPDKHRKNLKVQFTNWKRGYSEALDEIGEPAQEEIKRTKSIKSKKS